jgi:hypothetical protein
MYFLKLANVFLRVGMPHGCVGAFPEIDGQDTGVGRSNFIQPNSRILIENPWLAKLARKIWQNVTLNSLELKNTFNYF